MKLTRKQIKHLLQAFDLSSVEKVAQAIVALKVIGVTAFVREEVFAPRALYFFSEEDVLATQQENTGNTEVFQRFADAQNKYSWMWGEIRTYEDWWKPYV